MAQTLPPKEQNLFKSVVRLYETKQLKKAVKAADQILKKFPEHGETLAMKGLTINQLDRKVEAHELVRKGLTKDMRSHICWHVYGLLYRSDHDYHEAAKAYLNALRLDPNNQQILRDLALLQVQIRDFEGFEESRRKLLTVRPSQRNNWLGVAISFHLQKNYEQALRVLKAYQNTLDESAANAQDPFERSEILLYELSILEEAKDFSGALEHLEKSQERIVDKLSVREARARLLALLSRFEESVKELRQLIGINPNNYAYYKELWEALARSKGEENTDALSLNVCDEFAGLYPNVRAPVRIALGLLASGDDPQFLPRLDYYVRPFLYKGIPSLFSDLKSLYAEPSKVTAILTLFESYVVGLTSDKHKLPPPLSLDSMKQLSHHSEPEYDAVVVLMWTHHFLAQHFDRTGNFDRALTEIEAAISHVDCPVECLMVKARIVKHCGDIVGAVEVVNQARQTDLADRFINTKSTKYALRADDVAQAEAWISLFTRDGDSGGVQALYDMQCIWYELEAAESHLRTGQIPLALKKFIAVERHFSDMVEDQFDFHTYCLRKVTLRSYVQTLRMEDNIRSHPYFARAAAGIVKCLVTLEDMDSTERLAVTGGLMDVKGFSELSVSDRKKAISKMKKRAAKEKGKTGGTSGTSHSVPAGQTPHQKLQHAKLASGEANGNGPPQSAGENESQQKSPSNKSDDNTSAPNRQGGSSEKPKPNPGWMETDPNGLEFVKTLLDSKDSTSAILSEAMKRIRQLEGSCSREIETHKLAFELAMRKRRYLLALRAVRRAQNIACEHPDVLLMSIRLVHIFEMDKAANVVSNHVSAVFEQKGNILMQTDIVEEVNAYAARHTNNIECLVGAGEAMLWLASADVTGCGDANDALKFIVDSLDRVARGRVGDMTMTAEYCSKVLRIMSCREYGFNAPALEPVIAVFRKLYPRMSQIDTACRRRSRCAV